MNLWADEFYDMNAVLEMGAMKYAPRDWEREDCTSFQFPKNVDSMFHHLARQFVYEELESDIVELRSALAKARSSIAAYDPDMRHLMDLTAHLLDTLKLDKESGLNHSLHLATRALMGYTRKKRGLD